MRTNSAPYHQHRSAIGSHTRWQDRQQRSQKAQDNYAQSLAGRPGLHAGNVHRQSTAHAFVHLLSLLSAAQSCEKKFAITGQRAAVRTIEQRIRGADMSYAHRWSDPMTHAHAHETAGKATSEDAEKNPCHQHDVPGSTVSARAESSSLAAMVHPFVYPFTGARDQISQWVARHDPLRFPMSEAFPMAQLSTAIDEREADVEPRGVLNRGTLYQQTAKNDAVIRASEKSQPIEKFFEKFRTTCPDLKAVASNLLKTELQQKLHINLDPDQTYFMHFDWAMTDAKSFTGFAHVGEPIEERTLTDCLFTNFPADAQDDPTAVDQQAGIYKIPSANVTEFDSSNEVRLRPSDFMKLVWDIDFYTVAQATVNACWRHSDLHEINNAILFSMRLAQNSLKLNQHAMTNLLRGIGSINNNGETNVYPFDISGYEATDMLVFEDKTSGYRILYMPRSETSFVPFGSALEMREWVIGQCADEAHRHAIASHFSIKDRQEGKFLSGVDSLLQRFGNTVNSSHEFTKIAGKKQQIPAGKVLSHITERQKSRALSDLDKSIKSDQKIRTEMWERFFDAGNTVFPNPVTPFISLGFHINQMINGDTFEERKAGWRHLGSDMANFVLMAILSGVTEGAKLDFDIDAEQFVSDVRRDLSSFFKNGEFVSDTILPIDRLSFSKVERDTLVTSTSFKPISTSEQVLKRLAGLDVTDNVRHAMSPDSNGIMTVLRGDGSVAGSLIKIGDKVFDIEATNDLGNYRIGGKSGPEVYFDGKFYYEKMTAEHDEIRYTSCVRAKRSLDSPCAQLSGSINDILQKNIDKGFNENEVGPLTPDVELPWLFRNTQNNKWYFQYEHAFFDVKRNGRFGFSVFSRRPASVLQQLMPKNARKIADVFFSPSKGRHFLNTEIERTMEAMNLSRPAADLFLSKEKYIKSLGGEEFSSLHAYGRVNYDVINDFLRRGMPENYISQWIRREMIEQVGEIRSALSKIPPFKAKVFRGAAIDHSKFEQLRVGEIVSNAGFLSTSLDRDVAQLFVHPQSSRFKPMMYEIDVEKSAHPISWVTGKLNEAELLIEDDSYFEVVSKTDDVMALKEVRPSMLIAGDARIVRFDVLSDD